MRHFQQTLSYCRPISRLRSVEFPSLYTTYHVLRFCIRLYMKRSVFTILLEPRAKMSFVETGNPRVIVPWFELYLLRAAITAANFLEGCVDTFVYISRKVTMQMVSTLVHWFGNRDQLPDLRLVTCNGDPSYPPRHRPKAPPPFLFVILFP